MSAFQDQRSEAGFDLWVVGDTKADAVPLKFAFSKRAQVIGDDDLLDPSTGLLDDGCCIHVDVFVLKRMAVLRKDCILKWMFLG